MDLYASGAAPRRKGNSHFAIPDSQGIVPQFSGGQFNYPAMQHLIAMDQQNALLRALQAGGAAQRMPMTMGMPPDVLMQR